MTQTVIEKLQQLPASLKTLYFSDAPMLAGEEAMLLYGLSQEKMAFVTLPLGAIILGDMKLGEYPGEIAAKAGVDEGTAYGIAFEVNKRVFLKFPQLFTSAESLQTEWDGKRKPPIMSAEELEKKMTELEPWLFVKDEEESAGVKAIPRYSASTVKLPLLQALSEYEQLGNQLITEERIKLKSQPESVRPSLLYWIKYYRDELGIGHHSSVERGNFLFRSENGKKLTPEERERVNLVLKSVEENVPVEVDTEHDVIIFPSLGSQQSTQTPPVPPMAPSRITPEPRMVFQPARPQALSPVTIQGGGLTFTSNHVMPGEREAARSAARPTAPSTSTQAAAPAASLRPVRPGAPAPKANPFHIRPVSLGKEEE